MQRNDSQQSRDATTAIGVDIGSRTTKIVQVRGGDLIHADVFDTGHDPMPRVLKAVKALAADVIVATGYGRRLAQEHLDCSVMTEIRACARGARSQCPDAQSCIDIGGQDSKVIELLPDGGFNRFEMNDRCAAGTGRFLEVMASALGYTVEQIGSEAMRADRGVPINSLCTVFAESEVVSLIAKGEDRRRIALGLHMAAARRIAAMASRVDLGERVAFAGGVARNPCMVRELAEELGRPLVAPDRPELTVALGAALVGIKDCESPPS